MITITRLKEDLKFSQDLGDIVDVLKSATIIQSHLFAAKERPNKDFLKETEASLRLFSSQTGAASYFPDRPELPLVMIVVTSDEGFLGELNTLLVNTCLDRRKNKDDEIIILGERGARYLAEAGEAFRPLPGLTDEINYKEAESISSHLLKGYLKGQFRGAEVIYPEFISLTTQRVTALPLLPCPILKEEQPATTAASKEEVLIEPSPSRVGGILIKLWVSFKLLEIFFSSKQSEYAARLMHLEASTQELAHMNHRLSFQYFRQIHALNDKTIREVSSSKILLSRRQ